MAEGCEKQGIFLNEKESKLVLGLIKAMNYHRYLSEEELDLQKKLGGEAWQRGEK